MLVGAEALCCNSLPSSAGLEEAQRSPGVCGTAWNCMLKTMVVVSVVPSGKRKTHSNCSVLKICLLFPWHIPVGYQQTRYSSGTSCWEWITLAAAGGKEITVIVMAWNEQALTTLKLLSDTCLCLNWDSRRLKALLSRHYYIMQLKTALLFYAVTPRRVAGPLSNTVLLEHIYEINQSTSHNYQFMVDWSPECQCFKAGTQVFWTKKMQINLLRLKCSISVWIRSLKYRTMGVKSLDSSSIKILKYLISYPAWKFWSCTLFPEAEHTKYVYSYSHINDSNNNNKIPPPPPPPKYSTVLIKSKCCWFTSPDFSVHYMYSSFSLCQ